MTRKYPFYLIIGSLSLWLGFPNSFFIFPPIILIWPICLVLSGIYTDNNKRAFLYGWLICFLGGNCALYWLCYPVHDVGGLPLFPSLLCAMAISACIAVQGGIFSVLARECSLSTPVKAAIFLGILWYLLEYGFALIVGFPWLIIGGALSPWPILIQAMHIFGSFLLDGVWVMAALLIVLPIIKTENYFPSILLGCCILFLIPAYGITRLANHEIEGENIEAVFIEGNIDQNQKWVPAFQKKSLDIYIYLTEKAIENVNSLNIKPSIVIWPETALPFFLENQEDFKKRIMDLAGEIGCPLLFGAPGLPEGKTVYEDFVYNRAYLINPDQEIAGFYDKEHLVPFGEYLPQWLDLAFLKALLQDVGIYKTGTHTQPLVYKPLALGMLICYEGIFPWIAQNRVKEGANIFVDISNDGWFRKSPACWQHLFLTVPRCIEQNRWMLRSTNTGISAIVDNYGRLLVEGPQFKAGWVIGSAKLLSEKSIFHHIQFLLPWTFLIVELFIFYLIKKRVKPGKI